MPEDKLEKSIRIPVKKVGMAAKLQQAAKQGTDLEKGKDPLTCTNRIGLIFDDSGSMGNEPLQQAKDAVDAFLRNCNPADTSLALYPLNAPVKPLINNFPAVMITLLPIRSTGGTPLYTKLLELIDKEPITRAVAFSDGQPTDGTRYVQSTDPNVPSVQQMDKAVVSKYKEKKIPIDTIYVGHGDSPALQFLAEQTGGIYLKFTDMASLKAGLKYLTPGFRAMLMNPEVKEKLERGELK